MHSKAGLVVESNDETGDDVCQLFEVNHGRRTFRGVMQPTDVDTMYLLHLAVGSGLSALYGDLWPSQIGGSEVCRRWRRGHGLSGPKEGGGQFRDRMVILTKQQRHEYCFYKATSFFELYA